MELSQPTFSVNAAGKILVDKAPDGSRSPNLADSVMITYQPATAAAFFSAGMLAGQRTEAVPDVPAPWPTLQRIWAVAGASLQVEPIALNVLYLGLGPRDQPPRLYVLDWHVSALGDAKLAAWVSGIYSRLAELAKETRVLSGSAGLYVEPSGFGPAIFGAAIEGDHMEEFDLYLVSPPLANLDLAERAAAASRYIAVGATEIAAPARAKKVLFRGLNQNFLTEQILHFNAAVPDESAELASAFYLAVLLALEDPPREE
jgi:hypothetical protein